MASAPKPVERVMLEAVAYHDPIDYHQLRSVVGDRVSGGYSTDRHKGALDNLKELDMVERGGLAHEYVHITDSGWRHLGGETSRHDGDVESVDGLVCDVCATDEQVENPW
ncbi:hypothetical protein [Natronomonas gomsonensis]|uniref:hypothetical protein n=1 Tax=Natronomonas gomsonensis TaxID=1046043 RepID=UPI0015BC61F0|nr:hypothetical protein [Natronomonas gomsonensis]